MVTYREIICKSPCNKVDSFLPYHWDLNVYRGCFHGCKYCFAQYSHRYMDSERFFDEIFVKKNIPQMLEKFLRSRTWKGEVINLGGVTDNYQPAEEYYQLMPQILKICIRYKVPILLSTKSDLILRDYHLFAELAEVAPVQMAATVTVMAEEIRSKLEPGGVSSVRRLEMLRKMKQAGATIGIHIMPIIPYLTDSDENIESIFRYGKEIEADYCITGLLHLRGSTKEVFFSFLQQEYPQYYSDIAGLYVNGKLESQYKRKTTKRLQHFHEKYGLPTFFQPTPCKKAEQLSLFDNNL